MTSIPKFDQQAPVNFRIHPECKVVEYPQGMFRQRIPFPERASEECDDKVECLNLSEFVDFTSEGMKSVDAYVNACLSILYLTLHMKELEAIIVNTVKEIFLGNRVGSIKGNDKLDIQAFLEENDALIKKLDATAFKYHQSANAYFLSRMMKNLKEESETHSEVRYDKKSSSRIPAEMYEMQQLFKIIYNDAECFRMSEYETVTDKDIASFEDKLMGSVDTIGSNAFSSLFAGDSILEKSKIAITNSNPMDKMHLEIFSHVTAFTNPRYIRKALSPFRVSTATFNEFMSNELFMLGTIGTEKDPLYEEPIIYDLVGLLEFYMAKIQQSSVVCDWCRKMSPTDCLTVCVYCNIATYCVDKKCMEKDVLSHKPLCMVIRKVWKLSLDNEIRANRCIIS